MHRHTKKFLLKIFTLSTFIVLIFNIGDNLLNANISPLSSPSNQENFQNINNTRLARTGVAISTYLGIKDSNTNDPSGIIPTGGITPESSGEIEDILSENMALIKDYLNILKTDPKEIIDSSYDKANLLNAYIEQLEFRYQNGILAQKNLVDQRDTLTTNMSQILDQIDTLKTKISQDFSSSDAIKSTENIQTYLDLRTQYDFAKIYVVYINHFLTQYSFLNNYTKNLAGVLVNNKDAIIKDSYVVIPKIGGLEALKEFNLIYEQQ